MRHQYPIVYPIPSIPSIFSHSPPFHFFLTLQLVSKHKHASKYWVTEIWMAQCNIHVWTVNLPTGKYSCFSRLRIYTKRVKIGISVWMGLAAGAADIFNMFESTQRPREVLEPSWEILLFTCPQILLRFFPHKNSFLGQLFLQREFLNLKVRLSQSCYWYSVMLRGSRIRAMTKPKVK